MIISPCKLIHLEAAFSFGYILLGVEEDDVDLGHVEHSQRHRGGQVERDGQGGGLDIHLEREKRRTRGKEKERESHLSHFKLSELVWVIVQL